VYELITVLIFAIVALTVSLFTAYGVTFIRKRWAQEVSPMLEQVNEMLESKPLEQLNASMTWIKNYASTAPTVMLDHVEGIIDEKVQVMFAHAEGVINERMQVFAGHMESVVADTKDEVLEFANAYGQQAMAGAAKLLQGRGASLLGKEGREKSLANAQIRRATDTMKRQAIENVLPEGITYDMAESVAERFGVTVEEGIQYLNHPIAQKFLGGMNMNLSPGRNGPMQQAPPSPQAQPPIQDQGGRVPFDRLGT